MEIDLGAAVGHSEPAPSADAAFHTIPVSIVDSADALRVHQAPYDVGTARTKTLGVAAAQIQPADRHRGRVLLVGQAPFLVAFSGEVDASQDAASQMAWWPANVPLEIRHRSQIWAAAASGTCALSIIAERTSETRPLGVA